MYEWKIISVEAPDGELITEARYHVQLTDNDIVVETEGNWPFKDCVLRTPFADVTEEMVIEWIQKETTADGKNNIESRLAEQLFDVATRQNVVAPWQPQIFTPNI